MGLGNGTRKTLRTVFIKYVIYLGILIISLIIANYLIFAIASIGVYPANYSERVIEKNFNELKNATEVKMDLLSPMSNFGVYSEDGEYLYGNFTPKDIEKAWDSYNQGKNAIGPSNYISKIEREDEILIISYPLSLQFINEDLRRILPSAGVTILILLLFQLIILIILWASILAKMINNELKNLSNAVEKIRRQDLDFEVGISNIEDINVVLQGINIMKNSLKTALEKQWTLEQKKKEQISSLAHDVGTPLTIVKGNVGLLKETSMTEEQASYCNYIENSSNQMEEYLQRLLSITKEEKESDESSSIIHIKKLIGNLKDQGEALGKMKNINFVSNMDIDENLYIRGNEFELERAMLNIVRNAVDFSPKNSNIMINAVTGDCKLIIEIMDQGRGFSRKVLKYGKEQFFMEDESRTKTGHHGLGLYIADNIIRKFKGKLILSNDRNGSGLVKIEIPLENNEVK